MNDDENRINISFSAFGKDVEWELRDAAATAAVLVCLAVLAGMLLLAGYLLHP